MSLSHENVYPQEDPLSHRLVVRRGLLACAILFLLWLAWQAISGGIRQIGRSRTVGQKAETVTQVECGLLSLLVVLTCFRWRQWAAPVRTLWGISLVSAAGLSALVWGSPMPLIAIFFVAISLLVWRAMIGALRSFQITRSIVVHDKRHMTREGEICKMVEAGRL